MEIYVNFAYYYMAEFIEILRLLNLQIKNFRVWIVLVFFAQKDMCLQVLLHMLCTSVTLLVLSMLL